MTKFSKVEVEAFEKLVFVATAEPIFDPMRDCLRWEDEVPEAVSSEIYKKFTDLLIARKYLHEGRPKDNWWSVESTSYFLDLWLQALKEIPNWPGFKRLELGESDLEYFLAEKAKPPEEHY
jgi:hypothetical protein